MKIHPLFVHFPIALFLIYAVIEILGLDIKYAELKWTKRILGILSPIVAYISILTGGLLEDMFRNDANLRQIVRVHESMATLFMWVASILALGIIAEIIREKNIQLPSWANSLVTFFLFFSKRWVSLLLAVVGLILITVTGALGGILVYGPDVDPIAKLLYSLIVK
jgi:uncharacterized membrane protein